MKQSELLRKQADMMDMAEKYGVGDWRKLVQFRSSALEDWNEKQEDKFYVDTYYRFALGVVEGKPVFEGDTLYTDFGAKFTAGEHIANENGEYICEVGYSKRGCGVSCSVSNCTWNPPKPKTVMVELLREDAKYIVAHGLPGALACRKALENV